MTISLKINSFLHPYMVKYAQRAYIKKIEGKFKECPNLAALVDKETTIKHIQLYSKLGLPCSDRWLRFYSNLTGHVDYRYLPEDIFFCVIERVLNDCNRADGDIEDKNYLGLFVGKEYLPKTYVRFVRGVFYDEDNNYLSAVDVDNLLTSDKGDMIGKSASGSLGGHGVNAFVFKEGKYRSKDGTVLSAEWIKSNFQTYIVQEKLIQCDFGAQFNPRSVNTCRITTLRCPWNGEIVVTKAAMRFGVGDAVVDNMASGGIALGVGKRGELGPVAYSWKGMEKFDAHPLTHISFKGKVHPYYDKMSDVVIRCAKKITNFNLISWDVIADKDGEIKILEVNLVSEGTDIHQFSFGSFFGEYTEPLVDWISKNKKYDQFKHFRTFQ